MSAPASRAPWEKLLRRCRFELDSTGDVAGRLAAVAHEVVELPRSAGPDVLEIDLQIRAEKDEGFDTGTVRAVSENSRTLGATRARFEDA